MSTYLDETELGLLITDTDLVKYTQSSYAEAWQREVDDAETYFNILLSKRRLAKPADWDSVTDSSRQLIVAYLHMRMCLHRIGNNPQQTEIGVVFDLYNAKYKIYKDDFNYLESSMTNEMITGIEEEESTPSYVIPIVRR